MTEQRPNPAAQIGGGSHRLQATLATPIDCRGVGLHSGAPVHMTLSPAPIDHGITFERTDLPTGTGLIPARFDRVTDTRLCTLLSNEHGATVGTVEHLMAALAGTGINNLSITLDGPEVPIMDGSSAEFLFLIDCAGIETQNAPISAIEILKPVEVSKGDAVARLEPSDRFRIDFEIDFPCTVIGNQSGRLDLVNGAFRSHIAEARTFGYVQEVDMMRKMGLARGGSLENAIVVDAEAGSVLNPEGLRFDDEFVRHKTLDAVGDLALAGAPILGAYYGYKAGHGLTNELLRALFQTPGAWRWTNLAATSKGAHGGWTQGPVRADDLAQIA